MLDNVNVGSMVDNPYTPEHSEPTQPKTHSPAKNFNNELEQFEKDYSGLTNSALE